VQQAAKEAMVGRRVQVSELFAVTEDLDDRQLNVEFLAGQGFNLVPTRFPLLPSERRLFANVGYLEGVIKAYRRDPGRRVEAG
jgi:hypothetical protein